MEKASMVPFLSGMWVERKVDEAKLQTYVPKFITQEEKDLIVTLPRDPA